MHATSASAATLMPVTACGDVVPRGTIGYLTGDLDCTGVNGVASVYVQPGARLELRGFTLTGSILGVSCYALRGDPPRLYTTGGSCRIDGGGGRIAAASAHGVAGNSLFIRNLTIAGVGQEGVYADNKARLTAVTITNAGGHGVDARGAVLENTTITDSGEDGVAAKSIRLIDSTVTGSGTNLAECDGTSFPDVCADLVSERRPRLKNSQCETSLVPERTFPPQGWSVCQND
jgi:hypothetical protein